MTMVAMLGRREQLALLLLAVFAFQHSAGFFKKLITIEDDGINDESNEHVNLKFPTVKLLKPFNLFDKKKENLEKKNDALGPLIENKLEKWEAKKEKFDDKLLDLIDSIKEKEHAKFEKKVEIKEPAKDAKPPAPVTPPTPAPAPTPVYGPPSVYSPTPYSAPHHSPAPYHTQAAYHAPAPYHAPSPYQEPASYHAPTLYNSPPSAYGSQPIPPPAYKAPAPAPIYGHASAPSYKATVPVYGPPPAPAYRASAPAPGYGRPSTYEYQSPTPDPKYGYSSNLYSHYKPSRPAPYRYYVEHDCSDEQTYSYKPVRPVRPKPKPRPTTHYHDCDYEVHYFT